MSDQDGYEQTPKKTPPAATQRCSFTPEQEEEIRRPVMEKYEREGDPYYGSSRLWDDGVILPTDTRKVVGLALSACLNAPVKRGDAPVFRM